MIKWLNRNGVPEPIAIAIKESDRQYTSGPIKPFISSSKMEIEPMEFYGNKELASPTNVYYKDVADQYYIFIGNALHSYLEQMLLAFMKRTNSKRFALERRLYADIIVNDITYIIGGQFDCLDKLESQRKLIDWKTVSVSKYNTGLFESYEIQANVYLWMLRKGYIIENDKRIDMNNAGAGYKASLDFIMRDWSPMKANSSKYPRAGMQEFVLPVWTNEKVEALISKKITQLVSYESTPLKELPPCPMIRRWQDEDVYPVYKFNANGKPKSNPVAQAGTKSFPSKAIAQAFIAQRIASAITKPQKLAASLLYVGFRKSKPTRCVEFCSVGKAGICTWYNNWRKNNGKA